MTAGLIHFQVRRLICDQLASLLLLKTVPHDKASRKIDPESNRHGLGDRNPADAENTAPDSQTLSSILDLLETRISVDDEKRERSDRDAKMRRDWMLAAAVIDRLCFIVLTMAFVGGTLVFVVLFVSHPNV